MNNAPRPPARICTGCGHVETKKTRGPFRCDGCGATSFTLFYPEGKPLAGKQVDPRCDRCGVPLDEGTESALCDRCLRALGLD